MCYICLIKIIVAIYTAHFSLVVLELPFMNECYKAVPVFFQ